MKNKDFISELENLPLEAQDFIKLIIKKMRYRKKVRLEVMAELAGHFEDELRDCRSDEERKEKTKQLIEDFGDPKLLAVLLRRAKKRCRSPWRTAIARTLQAAALLILFLIIYVIWFLNGKPNITVDYVAELNKAVRPTVDESLNAAPLYHQAADLSETLSQEQNNLLAKKYFEATDQEKQDIKKILADNNQMLELVTKGTQKPYYWEEYKSNDNRMISVVLRDLSEFRKLAYALRWRAMFKAEQGQYEDAINDLLTCYRFGQHVKKGAGTLIEQLVGIAMKDISIRSIREILSSHQITPTVLAKLQNEMEQLSTNQNSVIDFSCEKLFLYDEIQRSFTDKRFFSNGHVVPNHIMQLALLNKVISGSSVEQLKPKAKKEKSNCFSKFVSDMHHELFESCGFIYEPTKWTAKLLSHPDKQQTKKAADEFYCFIEDVAGKTPAQVRTEGVDLDKETDKIVKGNTFLEILAPRVWKVIEIGHRVKTESYATIAVIALVRYKNDTGSYPADLQQLVTSGYLKQMPMDAFSDKPLVYKKTENDFTLYSVGLNFTDDGGQMGTDHGKPKTWANNGDMVFWPVSK